MDRKSGTSDYTIHEKLKLLLTVVLEKVLTYLTKVIE